MSLETQVLYEFGAFRCDPAEHLLLAGGRPIPLTPKSFDILVALLASNGRLVSKDELMRRVWPDSFVEEANLTVNISALRKALGESNGGQQYIETVPKRGYRFAVPVKEVRAERMASIAREPAFTSEAVVQELDSRPAAVSVNLTSAKTTSRRWLGIVVLLILASISGVMLYRTRSAEKPKATGPRRLAILPFRNLGQNADSDFLGLSLADAVITKLGYVSALAVRPSYAVEKYRQTQPLDIAKIAADLNVDTLLMGNFIHDGDDLRITCQLIDVRTENLLWKGAFDVRYEKLLTVQDNVTQQIIKGLEVSLSPSEAERIKPDEPVDPLAYEYYLRGVDLYARNDFPMAIKMLERSSEIAPSYALTWANLGKAYTANASFQFGGSESYRKAQAAFERALSLQPAQIEARIYMANLLTDTGRVEQAVPLLREALKTNPNHAEIHWELGYAYRFAGMLRESVAECEQARRLDPGVKLNSSTLNGYLYLDEYDKFLQSLPNSNDVALIVFYRGFGEYYQSRFAEAAKDFDRAFELNPALLQAQIGHALRYGIDHQPAKGLETLRDAEKKINERGVSDPEAIYKIGQAYAVLGDKASAFRVLKHSVQSGFFSYPYLSTDRLLSNLRGDDEFSSLMKAARERHEAFKKTFFG